jgi:hypothetical protein
LYKVANPSKRLGLNKRAFYDFPSKSSSKHTQRASGWKVQNHSERVRERQRERERGGTLKGYSISLMKGLA